MTTRIVRVGNTLTVEIPEELAAKASLIPGDSVEWVATESGNLALVKPKQSAIKQPAEMTLEELMDGLREGDKIGEFDWGQARGVEVW